MAGVLDGLRVVEGSAFVAAPLGGMTLAQLGADVIRFDGIGGGIDYRRWPVSKQGRSIYWAGLNKGKRSIAVDLHSEEGRELVTAIIATPGADAGVFLSNFAAVGWLSYDSLRAHREDLIHVNIMGNPDGSTAVDYTVNAASGFPMATGPVGASIPINHVLPAWDMAAGLTAAFAVMAAERHRTRTGEGQFVGLALADIAFAMVGNLGFLGQAQVLGENRPPLGNDMYGAFGRDFRTKDRRRVMVVAISNKQWRSLVRATEIEPHLPWIERAFEVDLSQEECRFEARDAIAALLSRWFATRTLEEVRSIFDRHGVCWGPYQTFTELIDIDWRCSEENPMFTDLDQPGIGMIRTPGTPLSFSKVEREPPRRAPELGEHTEPVLTELLGLSSAEVGRLVERGLVACAESAS
jgi:2-methylfumaryl-CoA isomerase